MARETIAVVSGLPRSGTSMMMSMLEAGGMPLLTDDIRTADEDNPRGYYEFERVKQIEHDQAWLEDAKGKAVKMVSALLERLPHSYSYNVIFMRRNLEEILASQRQMLIRRGRPVDPSADEQMTRIFRKHLRQVQHWLDTQPNIRVLYMQYRHVLDDPAGQAERVNRFLGNVLDVEAMADVVDASLHRQRR